MLSNFNIQHISLSCKTICAYEGKYNIIPLYDNWINDNLKEFGNIYDLHNI